MPTYAQLNQRHPSTNESLRSELCALYLGGEKLEKLYRTLLPQRDRERPKRYETRLKEAQYRNYLGPIIDYFASMLFVSRTVSKAKAKESGEPVEDPGEYWSKFREDCDRGGTDLDDLFKGLLTTAMADINGQAWFRTHQPAEVETDNRGDFEKLGLSDCWLEPLEGCRVFDWDTGEDGRLLWAVTHRIERKRNGLEGDRKTVVETWDHLTPESVQSFRVEYRDDKPPQKEDQIAAMGPPVPHRFGRVPLVCLELPDALRVGSRLRSPQLAHFRKLNAQAWSLASTCYAMRQYFVKDPDAFEKQISGPGYEVVLSQEDKADWSAPPSEHFSALDAEIKAEKDEIFRIAHQMALGVENNAAAVGRSAESKASDAESTRVVLVAFSRIVRETIEYTLDLISANRGEEFEWSVEGLDDFAALDAAAFLENLKLLKESGRIIPSKTFATAINERAAELFLPHMDEQTKAKVRKEIQSGTLDPAEERDLELAATSGLFQSPSGAERPSGDAREGETGAGGDRGRPEKREKPPRKPPSE